MDRLMWIVLAALVGSILSGGGVWLIGIGALKNTLRETFATVKDVNDLGSRVNGLQTVAIGAREVADKATADLRELSVIQEQHWERITEHIVRPLEQVSQRMEDLAKTQAVQANTLELLARQREDRASAPRRGNRT